GAAGSPLVEPDVQVSRIRLSGKHEVEGMHSSLLETDARASEVLQPHPSVLGVEAYPVGRTIRPLAAPLQMAREAFAHIAVDRPEGDARVPEREVVRPPFPMSIQLFHQPWEGFEALRRVGPRPQLLPFPGQGLLRRSHIQVAMLAPSPVAV